MAKHARQLKTSAPVQNRMDQLSQEGKNVKSPPAAQLQASTKQNSSVQHSIWMLPYVYEDVKHHFIVREGYRNRVYLDSEGYPTAGIGHLLVGDEKKRFPVGSHVSDEQVETWFRQDSQEAYSAALQMTLLIGYEGQSLVNALTAVNFQLGLDWNSEHQTTWRHLTSHNWVAAAREAANSAWFEQTPLRVVDFQRTLLQMAGQGGMSYEDLRDFNRNNISKYGVNWDSQVLESEFNRWEP